MSEYMIPSNDYESNDKHEETDHWRHANHNDDHQSCVRAYKRRVKVKWVRLAASHTLCPQKKHPRKFWFVVYV